jgi:hypothetical protein
MSDKVLSLLAGNIERKTVAERYRIAKNNALDKQNEPDCMLRVLKCDERERYCFIRPERRSPIRNYR